MNALVIDDNAKTRETLCALLEASGHFVQVHQAWQPYLVRSLMTRERIEVVFIRVRLWDADVFERIPGDQMPVVVFLSGGKERITEKEETTVTYSLREPYTENTLRKLMQRMVFLPRNERPHFFFVRFEGRYHKIVFDTVELIERMQGSYIRLHATAGRFLLPGSLVGIMEKLPQDKFIRISDGLIVPVAEMAKITGDAYEFKGKTYKLTYRFAAAARKEMAHWPDGL